jgi:exodeoxyribonuclease-1
MTHATFFWHDYETTGADTRRDRPTQFAGQRTTLELEPVGDPVSLFCRPAADVLPHPIAVLLTGITPQQCQREGIIEAEFAARVHDELAAPGTCGVGYNSIRFDDEITRNLLYRNFYDPYAREWENGNSRWDLIDLARLAHALRPEGIQWPRRDDGTPSFRLEHLAAANHLDQARAHDAASDVQALIAFARLLRVRQPRLWNYYLSLRKKQRAFELLDVARMAPVLHVSSRYPASRGCIAMVAPLAAHATHPNAVIVVDLDADPTELIELDAEAIAERVFISRDALPDGVARIPLKLVHANKSPALAPLTTLAGVETARLGLNVQRCLDHLERLRKAEGLAEKLRRVFASPARDGNADPELALYDGFLPDADRRLLRDVRSTPPVELARKAFPFRDPRYAELLFRYRARNWPETLDADEHARWREFRRRRIETATELTAITSQNYFATIAALRLDPAAAGKQSLLDSLEAWGRQAVET